MKLVVEIKFGFGDVVYRRTDPDGEAGIVTGWLIQGENPSIGVMYAIAFGKCETKHYAVELTRDKPVDGTPP